MREETTRDTARRSTMGSTRPMRSPLSPGMHHEKAYRPCCISTLLHRHRPPALPKQVHLRSRTDPRVGASTPASISCGPSASPTTAAPLPHVQRTIGCERVRLRSMRWPKSERMSLNLYLIMVGRSSDMPHAMTLTLGAKPIGRSIAGRKTPLLPT